MRILHEADIAGALIDRAALPEARAHVVAAAVLDALMQACPPHVIPHFGALARPRRSQRAIVTKAELIADVAVTADVRPGPALEAIEVVCATIADAWSADELRSVRTALSLELAALFTPAEDAAPVAGSAGGQRGERRTLSSGKPGPEHEIASSPPSDGEHTLAAGHPHPSLKSLRR